MQPLIKWPGGKSSEIEYIKDIIPRKYDRYIEPFCGGAAVYFYLQPEKAVINDISKNLTAFYSLIKAENSFFKHHMYELNTLWESIKHKTETSVELLKSLFKQYKMGAITKETADTMLKEYAGRVLDGVILYSVSTDVLYKEINRTLSDKFYRTLKNEIKLKIDLTEEDLEDNLITGVLSGVYMSVRLSFNRLEHMTDLPEQLYTKKNRIFLFYQRILLRLDVQIQQEGRFQHSLWRYRV